MMEEEYDEVVVVDNQPEIQVLTVTKPMSGVTTRSQTAAAKRAYAETLSAVDRKKVKTDELGKREFCREPVEDGNQGEEVMTLKEKVALLTGENKVLREFFEARNRRTRPVNENSTQIAKDQGQLETNVVGGTSGQELGAAMEPKEMENDKADNQLREPAIKPEPMVTDTTGNQLLEAEQVIPETMENGKDNVSVPAEVKEPESMAKPKEDEKREEAQPIKLVITKPTTLNLAPPNVIITSVQNTTQRSSIMQAQAGAVFRLDLSRVLANQPPVIPFTMTRQEYLDCHETWLKILRNPDSDTYYLSHKTLVNTADPRLRNLKAIGIRLAMGEYKNVGQFIIELHEMFKDLVFYVDLNNEKYVKMMNAAKHTVRVIRKMFPVEAKKIESIHRKSGNRAKPVVGRDNHQ